MPSPALLADRREVLLRPKPVKLHGLIEAQVDAVRTDLARHSVVLSPPAYSGTPPAPDPVDRFWWSLLLLICDPQLITGGKRLPQDAVM